MAANRKEGRNGFSNRMRAFVLFILMTFGLSGVIGLTTAAPANADEWEPSLTFSATTYCYPEDNEVYVRWQASTAGSDEDRGSVEWFLTSVSTTPVVPELSFDRPPGVSTSAVNDFKISAGYLPVGTYTLNVTAKWHKPGHPDQDVVIKSGTNTVEPCSDTPVSVTPTTHTVTPATCTTPGTLSLPAQPTGVDVTVNGNAVTTPWSTTTPGTYTVAYSEASGYTLTNDPSGTAVVGAKLAGSQCAPPVVLKPAASLKVKRKAHKVKAVLNNRASNQSVAYAIKAGKKCYTVTVSAGSTKTFTLKGKKKYPKGKKVTVTASGKMLAKVKVPKR